MPNRPNKPYSASTVKVATTGPIDLDEEIETIDGVEVAGSFKVLVKDQTDARENGVYFLRRGRLSRPLSRDLELTSGMLLAVQEGEENDNKLFILTSDNPIVIGQSDIEFGPIGSAAPDPDPSAPVAASLTSIVATGNPGEVEITGTGLGFNPGTLGMIRLYYEGGPFVQWDSWAALDGGTRIVLENQVLEGATISEVELFDDQTATNSIFTTTTIPDLPLTLVSSVPAIPSISSITATGNTGEIQLNGVGYLTNGSGTPVSAVEIMDTTETVNVTVQSGSFLSHTDDMIVVSIPQMSGRDAWIATVMYNEGANGRMFVANPAVPIP